MSRVFVDIGVSLDGFVAGPNRGPGNPLGDGGLAMHAWMFATAAFRERHPGVVSVESADGGRSASAADVDHGEADDARVRTVFARTGAWVLGKRMFDEGEVAWPERAPFQVPVFVVTRRPRAPWVRPGGTTFFFVTDGFASALAQARAAAAGKDVRIGGGADVVQQALAAGVVDDLTLHVAPVLLGRGLRLFDGVWPAGVELEPCGAAASPRVHHLDFRVRNRVG